MKRFALALALTSCAPQWGDWNSGSANGFEIVWPPNTDRSSAITVLAMGNGTFAEARAGCLSHGMHLATSGIVFAYITEHGDDPCWQGQLVTWTGTGGAFYGNEFHASEPSTNLLDYHCSP